MTRHDPAAQSTVDGTQSSIYSRSLFSQTKMGHLKPLGPGDLSKNNWDVDGSEDITVYILINKSASAYNVN